VLTGISTALVVICSPQSNTALINVDFIFIVGLELRKISSVRRYTTARVSSIPLPKTARFLSRFAGKNQWASCYILADMTETLNTPSLVIDGAIVRRNLKRMADYCAAHQLQLRPHTKTHKSIRLGRMQIESGAMGLTVAKVGEAQVMSQASSDVLMAYPAVDSWRCIALAELAKTKTVRVAIDSAEAAQALSDAAASAGSTIGILIDIDVGMHRTGVQSPGAALELAQIVSNKRGLRLDGLMFYPGHVGGPVEQQPAALKAIDAVLGETKSLWKTKGLECRIISGGSTPTGFQSHAMSHLTEVRPGTYIFNDMNCVAGGFAQIDDCAARIVCTVVSTAVSKQFVIDAGTKTLTSDRCGPAPESGHGRILEYPDAKIVKLTEEHGQVDVSTSPRVPKIGERVTVIPNHICPCVNLQDRVWWRESDGSLEPLNVDARGKLN
jgi:D-serine deaminase-like pyridoxal phosphate-dependent protein